MILHLVRHGQSTWNAEGRLQGQTMEVPLTARGRQQATHAVVALSRRPLAAVWSSDQLRARDTAELIAAPHRMDVTCSSLLREQALGNLEGRLIAELGAQVPENAFCTGVLRGGGESLQQVHHRMLRLCDSLATQFGDTDEVVLVSHGDTLRVLLAVLAGRDHHEIEWVPVQNCQVVTRTLIPVSSHDDC
ncbi:histidine phosphatase family protein [Tessaracoccus sp.]